MDANAVFEAAAAETAATVIDDLKRLAAEMQQAEEEVAAADLALKKAKSRFNELKTKKVPEKLAEAGLKSIETEDGYTVKLAMFTSGSINNAPNGVEDAIGYLSSIGGEQIIKNVVSIPFGRGQDNLAKSLYAELKERHHGEEGLPEPDNKLSVHPQTLGGFIREKLESGEKVDVARLGMEIGNYAKGELPK